MTPPAPTTHGKKARRSMKLTSSLSSARLCGDGDSTSKLSSILPPVILLSVRAALPPNAPTRVPACC
ncbi:hypothetical protein IMZ48_43075 [Candidatus Bathyarchaeota archaeon]|nr:hypothetical protein [Candidatus Bathyarchaeota archaeon]